MLSLDEALQEFLTRCRVKNLSPNTIRWYEERITRAVGFWRSSGVEHLQDITPRAVRAVLEDAAARGNRATSLNATWRALHAFCQFWVKEEELMRNPVAKVDRVKEPEHLPQVLDEQEVRLLLGVFHKPSFRDRRDQMAACLLVDAGLRRGELCDLQIDDVDLVERTLHVRHGKGDKERYAHVGLATSAELQKYLRARRQWLGDRPNAWLFPSMAGTGRLSGDRIARILAAAAKAAGLQHVHPHLLRHTCFTMMAENGATAWAIKQQAGHAEISTSDRYVHMRRGKARDQYDAASPLDHAARAKADRRV